MQNINSLPLLQQIDHYAAQGLLLVKTYGKDDCVNRTITPMPGCTLKICDLLVSCNVDNVTIYSDGVVIDVEVEDTHVIVTRSNLNDYGIVDGRQSAWIEVSTEKT